MLGRGIAAAVRGLEADFVTHAPRSLDSSNDLHTHISPTTGQGLKLPRRPQYAGGRPELSTGYYYPASVTSGHASRTLGDRTHLGVNVLVKASSVSCYEGAGLIFQGVS